LERHFEIDDGAVGYTYERIFCPYLNDAQEIYIEDPYLQRPYQIENLTRFCALATRLGAVRSIKVLTGLPPAESADDNESRLETLRRDLKTRGIHFEWVRSGSLHDREIRLDNGWSIKVGRGLDIYHKPEQWLSIEAADFSMRRCRQTKVDVFRITPPPTS
jgi:ATP-dependent Lon protease